MARPRGVPPVGVYARAVGATLEAATTPGGMDKVRGQLKAEYAEVFGQQTG
jgi:hypothetical protein